MAQSLIFDLSGQKGLVANYYGDLNDTTAQPNRRYLGTDGESADGMFNPLKKLGYMCPPNNSFVTITTAPNATLIATEYDSINDDAYLAESGAVIWRLDGLDDTSLTADTTVNQTGTEVLTDMEIYELYGTRCLFYSYNRTDGSSYFSMIGYKGLDSNSGSYSVDSTDLNNDDIQGTITAGGTYQKLAQSYTNGVIGDPSITFNRIGIPITRNVADNGGYTMQVSIQDDVEDNRNILQLRSASSQFASITDASQTGLDLTNKLTIEAWVNLVSAPTGTYAIVAKWAGQKAYEFFYADNAGNKQLGLDLSSDGTAENNQAVTITDLPASATTPNANWKHICVSWDGATGAILFYVDSVQVGSATGLIGSIFNANSSFKVGARNADHFANINVAEVRVWNVVRTQTQIANSFRTPLGGTETGLVTYYTFNNVYTDGSGHSNTLTSSGSPTFTTSNAGNITTLVHAPDNSFNASATFNPTTVTQQITGANEGEVMYYFNLDQTVTLTGGDTIWIVLEATSFAAMTASDEFNWYGRDTNPVGGIAYDQLYKYNGKGWETIGSTTGLNADNKYDFDFQFILNTSQTWSKDLVNGSLTLANNADLFFCKADNGLMYLFEDNKVHKIDGALTGGPTGTLTPNVLRFPSYFHCTDAVDVRGKMYIAVQANPSDGITDTRTYSESECGIYTWDRQSTIFGTRDFIPLSGCRDIKKLYVDPNGDVRAICIGDDRFVQIRSISSGYGKVIKTLGLGAYPTTRDSLKVSNNMTHWLASDGCFYMHGSPMIGAPEALYKTGTMSGQATGAFTTGSILFGHNEATESRQSIVFSFTDTSTRRTRKWYPFGIGGVSSQTPGQGDVYTLVKMLPIHSVVRRINLRMLPGVTSDTTVVANLKIYFNQSSTPWATKPITKADCKRGWQTIEINQPNVNSIQLEVEWVTSVTIGDDNFQPILAEVIYDQEGRIDNQR